MCSPVYLLELTNPVAMLECFHSFILICFDRPLVLVRSALVLVRTGTSRRAVGWNNIWRPLSQVPGPAVLGPAVPAGRPRLFVGFLFVVGFAPSSLLASLFLVGFACRRLLWCLLSKHQVVFGLPHWLIWRLEPGLPCNTQRLWALLQEYLSWFCLDQHLILLRGLSIWRCFYSV